MGVKQAEMVKAKLFKVSMEELRCRHCFLERRGFYQTPDKKGQTLIVNPKLKDFLFTPEDVFLSQFAMATKEELDMFRKLIAREDEEKGKMLEYGDIEEDKEEDEGEEDLTDFRRGNMGHMGYERNKRKRWGLGGDVSWVFSSKGQSCYCQDYLVPYEKESALLYY